MQPLQEGEPLLQGVPGLLGESPGVEGGESQGAPLDQLALQGAPGGNGPAVLRGAAALLPIPHTVRTCRRRRCHHPSLKLCHPFHSHSRRLRGTWAEREPEPPPEPRWQRQVTAWEALAKKYGIQPDRYDEFEYLQYFPIGDSYIENYAKFHLGIEEPIIRGRIRSHYNFWCTLTDIPWLRDIISTGVKIPFAATDCYAK
jgi:hypothetical protein